MEKPVNIRKLKSCMSFSNIEIKITTKKMEKQCFLQRSINLKNVTKWKENTNSMLWILYIYKGGYRSWHVL